ncbi:MAG: strawberry notch C-terminal domain-containing protein, partial [Cyanobacteria bacterium P01_H01_bin.121]
MPEQEHGEASVFYQPRSQGKSPGTLIPANMGASAQTALDHLQDSLEQQYGHRNIDEFVAERLGTTKDDLWQHFYAEQIDALALGLIQRDAGKIFLNGDQTGNGKGRWAAGNIIDAQRQGYIPVFVTQKPNLYAAMLEDLSDIGHPEIQPFYTNRDLKMALPSGDTIRTGSAREQAERMQQILQTTNNSELNALGYNAIFTTYNQLQTVSGRDTDRRRFLEQIAPRAVFIFDEVHEAGGSVGQAQAWKRKGQAANRADFVRSLVDRAAGAVFASATSTKAPEVMDLYARRSDAATAVSNLDNLKYLLKQGGVPLQQLMAAKFAASGQMLRRERPFTNISFETQTVPVNREIADSISAIMRTIDTFDRAKRTAVKEYNKAMRAEAKAVSEDNAIGRAGAQSTNFTSLMHNAIDQSLLAQKSEATVQMALNSLQRGEKPVIALASTMSSFIEWYTKENQIETGDGLDISFADVLDRYLERSRDVVLTDYEGHQTRHALTDEELGDDAMLAFAAAKELIEANRDLIQQQIPLSPIDYITWRLEQEGYKVGEITSREHIVDYTGNGHTSYTKRSERERNPQAKVQTAAKFNSGELDVIILNRSGATGISLHASEKFTDQRQRHMIVAQPEQDINQVMQMLGRTNRFGQVVEPKMTLLTSDLPAEKRLASLLSKKMASLNANTTAARDSALSVSQVVDFMNSIGEEVAIELLENNPDLDARLNYPSKAKGGESEFDVISKVTGRLPLLPIEEQEEIYRIIEAETSELIAQKEAMGENILEAEHLDLDGRTIAQMELIPNDTTIQNEFSGDVLLEIIDAKETVKPFSELEVINRVRTELGLAEVKSPAAHDFDTAAEQSQSYSQTRLAEVREKTQDYLAQTQAKLTPKAYETLEAKQADHLARLKLVLDDLPVGTPVQIAAPNGQVTYGVISKYSQKGYRGSPAAPTNWRVQILTQNRAKQIQIPLTKINTNQESSLKIHRTEETWRGESVYQEFDRPRKGRTELQMMTGNLLKAYEKYPKGQCVNFTDRHGNVRQGIIMPENFDINQELAKEPIVFATADQVREFFQRTENRGEVNDLQQILKLQVAGSAQFTNEKPTFFKLSVPTAKRVGGQYFLDSDLLEAVGGDFYSVDTQTMQVQFEAERLEAVVSVLQEKGALACHSDYHKMVARLITGQDLPKLEAIPETPIPAPVEANATINRTGYAERVAPIVQAIWLRESQGRPRLKAATFDAYQIRINAEQQPELFKQGEPLLGWSDSLPQNLGLSESDCAAIEHYNQFSQEQNQSVQKSVEVAQATPGATTPEQEAQRSDRPDIVAPFKAQFGGAEKYVAKFLHDANLAEAISIQDSFHLRIENEPYIPLVIERVDQQLYLTHYLEQNGDLILDSEMVFDLYDNGYLRLKETAVSCYGEHRGCDRGFAQIFAKNINHQGFADAAKLTLAVQAQENALAAARKGSSWSDSF